MIVRSPTTTQAPKVRGCAAAAEKRNLLSRRAGVAKSGGGGSGGHRRAAPGSGSISTKPGCRAVIDSLLPLLDDCKTQQRSVAAALQSGDDVHEKEGRSGSRSGSGRPGDGDDDDDDDDDADGDDGGSECSDKCSRSTCSGCCDDEQCSDECADSCFGFIDCDDADACTSRDCAESECRETAPPCFDFNCLQSPAAIDATAAVAAASMFQPHHVAPLAQHGHEDLSAFAYSGDAFRDHPQSTPHCTDMLYPPYTTTATAASYIPNNNLLVPSETAAFSSCAGADGSLMNHHHHHPSAAGPGAYVGAGLDAPPLSAATESSHLVPHYHTTQPFYCQWGGNCDGQFFDWTALDEHVAQDHIKPLSEMQCRWNECQQAVNPAEMVAHVLNNHPPDGAPPTCRWTECSLTFPGPEGLESHVRSTHVPAYPLHCQWDSCGALALDAVDLSQHLHVDHSLAAPPPLLAARNAAEEAMTATTTPATTTATATTMVSTTPRRSPSSSAGAQPRCRWLVASTDASGVGSGEGHECGVVCHDAASLQQHIKEAHISSLTKKAGFLCRWADCARKDSHPFGQKGKLERHIQVHTGFKSCRCSICGHDFSGPLALQQHERRHTGEKPYRCDRCGKQFAQGTALTMHIRTHTKEKPLKCDFPGCNKTFSESSTLSKHKKTHSATGQYACEYRECNSSFHRLDQRKRHYNLVHGGPPTVSTRT